MSDIYIRHGNHWRKAQRRLPEPPTLLLNHLGGSKPRRDVWDAQRNTAWPR
jgi:hypothetical protein